MQTLEKLKSHFSFLEGKELKNIGFGLLMLILYIVFPCFNNQVSNFIMQFGIPVFIILCFLLIFLKYSTFKSIPIISFPKDTAQETTKKTEGETESKETDLTSAQPQVFSIKMENINKMFAPIKFLAFLFFYLNLGSVAYFYAYPTFFKDKTITLTMADLTRTNTYLSMPMFSQKDLLDSINHAYPRSVFFAFPKITSFNLDTVPGQWNYHATFANSNQQEKKNLSVSNLKLHIFNFTHCKVQEFCTCDSANICLKNSYIEMYYMLALVKDKIKDTVYFARFLPK